MVDGTPAGLHWQLGDNLERAEQSFSAQLQRDITDSQTRVYRANVLLALGELQDARKDYLRAFLLGPRAIDVTTVADAAVVEVLEIARSEYQTPQDRRDWLAAVGIVEGVFPMPIVPLPGIEAVTVFSTSPGLAFYQRIVDERAARSHNERTSARAQMKALCPRLFTAYLERFR